jgi:hypothetical protein
MEKGLDVHGQNAEDGEPAQDINGDDSFFFMYRFGGSMQRGKFGYCHDSAHVLAP